MTQPISPYVVVPLLGADGHGKSTLAGALANAAQVAPRWIQVEGRSAALFDLPGPGRVWQLVDFPDVETARALLPTTRAQGAVLVVSALDGVVHETVASLEAAHDARVPIVVIAMTKCDVAADPELADLVGLEVRECLSKHHMGGDATPLVQLPCAAGQAHARDGMRELLGYIQRCP
jgi:elongation factor Tu